MSSSKAQVELYLEMGHICNVKDHIWAKPDYWPQNPTEATHDWEFFIRDKNRGDMTQYTEKVVIHLHETFKNPKRVLKDPPFEIKEQGYAGFTINVEIYFKGLSEADPSRVFRQKYELDLVPSLEMLKADPQRKTVRQRRVLASMKKLTIGHKNQNFIKSLIKGGGKLIEPSKSSSSKNPPPSSQSQQLSKTSSSSSISGGSSGSKGRDSASGSSSRRRSRSRERSSKAGDEKSDKNKSTSGGDKSVDKSSRDKSSKDRTRESSSKRSGDDKRSSSTTTSATATSLVPSSSLSSSQPSQPTLTSSLQPPATSGSSKDTHKPRVSDTFKNLFGEPIQKSDSSKKDSSRSSRSSKTSDRRESPSRSNKSKSEDKDKRIEKMSIPKYPVDVKKDKDKEKDRDKDKERRKEKEREKEKEKEREKKKKAEQKSKEAAEKIKKEKELEDKLERERKEKEERELKERKRREEEAAAVARREEQERREREEAERQRIQRQREEKEEAERLWQLQEEAAAERQRLGRQQLLQEEAERQRRQKELEEAEQKEKKTKGLMAGILKGKKAKAEKVIHVKAELSDSDVSMGDTSSSLPVEVTTSGGKQKKSKKEKKRKKEKKKEKKKKEKKQSRRSRKSSDAPSTSAPPPPKVTPISESSESEVGHPPDIPSPARRLSSPLCAVSPMSSRSSSRSSVRWVSSKENNTDDGNDSDHHGKSSRKWATSKPEPNAAINPPSTSSSEPSSPQVRRKKASVKAGRTKKNSSHKSKMLTEHLTVKHSTSSFSSDSEAVKAPPSKPSPALVRKLMSPLRDSSEDEKILSPKESKRNSRRVGSTRKISTMMSSNDEESDHKPLVGLTPTHVDQLPVAVKQEVDDDLLNYPVQAEHNNYPPMSDFSVEYLDVLEQIQDRILNPRKEDDLDGVVRLIQQTGCYATDSENVSFDLCLLDKRTVKKITRCLGINVK